MTLGLLVAATSLLPLAFVIVESVELGLADAWQLLTKPRFDDLLWNTTRLLVGGVALSVVLGVGGAWLVVRTDLPFTGLWHGLLCAPLAVPAFVNGYAWVSTTHAVQSYPGAVLVVSLSYYPLVYLPTVAAPHRLPRAAAQGSRRRLRRSARRWSGERRVAASHSRRARTRVGKEHLTHRFRAPVRRLSNPEHLDRLSTYASLALTSRGERAHEICRRACRSMHHRRIS